MLVRKSRLNWAFCAALTLLLCGCGGGQPAPIASRQAPPSLRITHHIVEKGETLFELAWRYEKDLQKLAAVNGLAKPYAIYPGQRLNLDTSRYVASTPNVIPRQAIKPTASAAKPNVAVQPPLRAPKQTKSTQTASQKNQPVAASVLKPLPSHWSWAWPVKGRVVRNFDTGNFFKGIDIVSLPGAPVYPAAPGVVVYSGSGLRGYGHLIIIKHDDIYLSAYAHNRKVFIKEGQQVLQQQKIAEVGGDPANIRRFYFEIRKDGKPVNPLQYLP